MYHTQTIDLRDDLSTVSEQHDLLARLAELSDQHGPAAWSDDHGLNLLMQRYEDSAQRLSA
ncbi:MAG: hypothetical protein JWL76_8 [Thermoleophilia bacterium]|nr:hypothetical protein [Thermoleophilia bacterium]